MKKSIRMICCFALLLFIAITNALPTLVAGSDTYSKTIRVGYMNHPGFIEKVDDERYEGVCAEYLQEICKHAGWKIEYVEAPWSEQLEMLENDQLDVVGMAQYSVERSLRFNFTRQPIGIFQALLITLPEGQNDIKNDATSCNGKKIGILKGSRNIEYLEQYAMSVGFTYSLVEFETQGQLNQALLEKTVDIIVGEQRVKDNGLRVLDRFASDPYYLITSKTNQELVEELNYYIGMINAYDPSYALRLHQKYYKNGLAPERPYFTKEESEYIKSHSQITLAAIPDNAPLVYTGKSGKMTGIITDIMDKVTEFSGIKFNYEYVPKDVTPLAFLNNNPTYFGTGMLATNPAFEEENILVSKTYYTTHAALVAHNSKNASPDYKNGKYKIAIPQSFQAMQFFLKENYPNLEIELYLSVEDGLKALESGKVDLFAYTINLITPHLSNPLYGDIYILDSQFMPCPLCMVGINNDDNAIFMNIVNKCISMIPESYIAQLESEYFYQTSYHYNSYDVFYRYQGILIPVTIAVIMVIVLLFFFLWLRERKFHKDIIIRSEYDMMTGLYNRNTMKKKVYQALKENDGINCAFLVFDIDNLNQINETNGHSVGDEIIKTVANIVKKQFGGSSITGRVGGDDFAVMLMGIESKSVLVTNLTKFQKMVGACAVTAVASTFSISIGVAMFKVGDVVPDEAFQQAHEAMRRVKSNGKDGFAFYTPQKTTPYSSIYRQLIDEDKQKNNENEQPPLQETNDFVTGSHTDCESDFRRLVESFPNVALYVIDQKTHKVLYYNKRFKEYCPNVEIGISCRNIMVGPCDNCIVDTMGEQKMAHTIFYNDAFGDEVEITATKIVWGGNLSAVMISIWPRTLLTSSSDKLSKLSNHDSFDYVTGGLTRQGFIHMMERMQSCGVDMTEYAVLFINIQDFKAVNELVGSKGGDNLLRTMFARVEQSDLCPIIGARKESDHFVYLVEKRTLDFEKLSKLLHFHWQYDNKNLYILGRCGVFMIEDSALEIYKMIDRAKLAKDHIVDEYVKPYEIYAPSMLEEYSEKAEAFLLFDQGIKNNEFIVYYQPVIDVKTQKIIGAEALVRRRTADGTIVSPGKFIPILERTGYISMLDKFVGSEVLKFQQHRSKTQLPIVPISFNLSQKDFYDAELMELLAERFEKDSFPKGVILLEVTESAYTLNEKVQEGFLKRLRNAGAKILLDDFGTGYSSFGMFKNYEFDRVKLDMSFVRQLCQNENVRQVVESIIIMCHNMGVNVVAEGVETAEEFEILKQLNCDCIQGYYFSKPLPQDEFEKYIKEHI